MGRFTVRGGAAKFLFGHGAEFRYNRFGMFLPPYLLRSCFSALRHRHRALFTAPAFAANGETGAVNARFFRNPPARPPWREDPPPPPPDDRNRFEPHNPLSEREQRAYLILTAVGCLPFLLLLLLVIITHSPFMAN